MRTTAIRSLRGLVERASTPVSAASTVAFRVAFGVCGALVAVRFVARGWVAALYLDPKFHFTYPGLSWVRPLPAWAMYGLYVVMVVASLAFAAGWRPRWSAAAFLLAFAYAEAIDATTYLNHYELVTLVGLLGVVLPFPGRGRAARATVPMGVVWLLRFQLGLVYVFAGIGKIDADWLFRGEPLHTWLTGRVDLPVVGPFLGSVGLAIVLSWAGAVFDLGVVAGLLTRRLRGWAYVAVVGFHVATGLLFPAIGTFPLLMIVLTPIFFEPDWPDRVRSRVPMAPAVPAVIAPRPRRSRLVYASAGVWIVVQLLVPLRHLAYPGDVRWTEEGYRWSWRVLLTEKQGSAVFRVTDPATGRTRTVWPSDELTPNQTQVDVDPPRPVARVRAITSPRSRRGAVACDRRCVWMHG